MASRKRPKTADSECVIPTRPPTQVLRQYLLESRSHEEREVVEYIEWQLSKGEDSPATVEHLEPVKEEVVWGRTHKLWDVHTTAGRWWVVSEPMNLYSQDHFPSADYLLSFHVGLMARVASRNSRKAASGTAARFTAAWRRWEQAAAAVDAAKEAEDFQAVGMKCRECLLAFVRSSHADVQIPPGMEPPKRGDFVHWSGLLVDFAAPGAKGKDLRSHLKQVSTSAWQLVNWLTHTTSAVRHDAELAVDATSHVLESLARTLMRREADAPDRCPRCSSFQVRSFYQPEDDGQPEYILVCTACDWQSRLAEPVQ